MPLLASGGVIGRTPTLGGWGTHWSKAGERVPRVSDGVLIGVAAQSKGLPCMETLLGRDEIEREKEGENT